MKLDTGIDDRHRELIAQGLGRLLADSYTLYLQTQNFHWNVSGPTFHSLHTLFEAQYQEMIPAIDVIAERIRALGAPAPATFEEFMRLSSFKQAEGVPSTTQMLKTLIDGQGAVIRTAREVLPMAEKGLDQATLDLITERLEVHEKNAWMLRSSLG